MNNLCKVIPANIYLGNNPHNHQLPLHSNPQDNRHTLRNHHHRNRHILHNLLPSRHHCRPKQQDLHRHRVRDPHNLRVPLHTHQDRNFHSRRSRHLHWYRLQHHYRRELHHCLPNQHYPCRARPNRDCHLHCYPQPDRHSHQRPIHHKHPCANNLCVHSCRTKPGRYYLGSSPTSRHCSRHWCARQANNHTLHRCCQQAQRWRYCWRYLGFRCLRFVRSLTHSQPGVVIANHNIVGSIYIGDNVGGERSEGKSKMHSLERATSNVCR